MNISELIEFHKKGAEACEAYSGTPPETRAVTKDICKHYQKKAAWHRDAVGLLELVANLAAVGELIRDQDNWGTDQPMFAVMEKRETITLDTHNHDRIVWVRKDDSEVEADERTHERLERLYENGVEPKKWDRYAILKADAFVTAAFTKKACVDHIACNGHNLREPFIYAFGSYRNAEFQMIRKTLLALAGTSPK